MNMQLNKAFYLYLTFVAILWAIIWWCLLINMHQYFSAVFYVLTGYYFINKILMKISPYSSKILFTVGEFKHEVRQFQKPYDNQQAEQISLMV